MAQPGVSIIVPVRNGVRDISELLECLSRQTMPRDGFEIVIGDDGSQDAVADVVRAHGENARLISGGPTNSYAARNRAVAASRASVLAFCDADCRPEPNWLEAGLAELEVTDMAAGRIRFAVPAGRTVWTLVDMDGSKDHAHQVRVGVAETANLFLRRDLYDRVGGFDGSIPEYGDFEFVRRCVAAGAKLTYAPDAVVWHPARTSGSALLRALWKYNRGYAVHEGRAGGVPDAVKLRSWVPIVQTVRSRRRWGKPYGPDRRWLDENGVEITSGELLRSLPILYLVIPYLQSLSQLAGWLEGRKRRGEHVPTLEPNRRQLRGSI